MSAQEPLQEGTRGFTIEADAFTLEKMRKEGQSGPFTLYCDEPPQIGGEGTAPTPLQYFCLAVGF